jgi:5'-3' exonuclease
MSVELTSDYWVPELNRSIWACTDVNSLLQVIPSLIDLRRFEGVFPACAIEARKQMYALGGSGGVTTVIDGEGLLFRAGFACRDVKDTASSVISILRKIWKATLPRHFIVAFDDERRIKRELFPEYKSDRKPDPKKQEIEAIKPEVIDAVLDNHVQVEISDGFEADDIIASVSAQCQILDQECVIVGTDHDFWQCLGPKTTIYNRKDEMFLGTQWLKSQHKITPAQAIDWLVLTGKNGIPGAHCIGPDTASRLLEAYGTFHDILSSTSLTPAKRAAIEAIDYWRLRQIHSLNRTIPVLRT